MRNDSFYNNHRKSDTLRYCNQLARSYLRRYIVYPHGERGILLRVEYGPDRGKHFG